VAKTKALQVFSQLWGRIKQHSPKALHNFSVHFASTVILPVVSYGRQTWSLTLREEHRLRVLRRIFGPEREAVSSGGRLDKTAQ
jgi:hypothetical protein